MKTGLTALCIVAALMGTACQSSGPAATQQTASSDGFRNAFTVEKSNLGPTGASQFFILKPGTLLKYKDHEGATLAIKVLDQTRTVDGVTTRVIEEHEEEGGKVKEISRNFFAIDRATNDVYYFGEEVDIYKDGKIASHGGAWQSGVGGARFGLALPAKPPVGDKYYQEVAPGIAMDRGEVVSIDERVVTPAGTFEHCVHVKETTPIEKDTGHKWYAPGIGLVRDDELVLVSHSIPK